MKTPDARNYHAYKEPKGKLLPSTRKGYGIVIDPKVVWMRSTESPEQPLKP